MLPAAMLEITRLFEGVTEDQRRELLLSLAASAPRWQPVPDELFDFNDIRKDADCSDAAGIHLRRRKDGKLTLRISLGPEVQTLTRAMAAVLCQGLEGSTACEIAAVPESLATEIAGTELVRLRSRSVYYLLRRVKEAAEQLSRGCG
jgi:cysteine desulfuration protein SufE